MTAVPASSVLLLRASANGTASPYEVLMIRRHAAASFVPDAWVFPGGMVEDLDRHISAERYAGSLLDTMRLAAVRELFEETGVWLGLPLADSEGKRRRLLAGNLGLRQLLDEGPVELDRLVWTSHWITPEGVPKRFDTWFFLAIAPADANPSIVNDEAVDATWLTPEQAIASLKMVFPTIRNLEAIRGFISVEALLASRHSAEIKPVQPVIIDGKITLP